MEKGVPEPRGACTCGNPRMLNGSVVADTIQAIVLVADPTHAVAVAVAVDSSLTAKLAVQQQSTPEIHKLST
ncbi:hypothetical protein EZV62_017268 [Acer yangbiense]|uniref:Uncharacterized protein n=1 Tax=Acer yangbiense TaxID=1000413 RepID=A0A5C7HGY6_9ROSI|nr:hypothetical protein EZV62_017268 [Acer yangbiense]